VDIGNLSLADFIRIAYKIKPYQLTGPDWMTAQRFDIQAKLPEGATKDQLPEMMQSLLADRFKLTIHRDTKEHSIYALVPGKNGIKMKESEPDVPAAAAEPGAPPAAPPGSGGMVVGSGENQVRIKPSGDGKGFSVGGGPAGPMKMSMGEGGLMRMEFAKMSMAALADILSRFVDRPVVDMTELKGIYQVALSLSMDEMRAIARTAGAAAGIMMPMPGAGAADAVRRPSDAASAPSTSIFTTVQQLGLKLEPRKAPIETIVVDHLEKTPTEN
jgi:uncharacterized protein (TIGR03435 family)